MWHHLDFGVGWVGGALRFSWPFSPHCLFDIASSLMLLSNDKVLLSGQQLDRLEKLAWFEPLILQ